ncbi:MAG: isochorismatase family protein [Janthinobacterium lividum]
MAALKLDPRASALVLIDLQHGVSGLPLAPYSGAEVVERCARLAETFRAKGALVAYVRVEISDMVHLPTDAPTRDPNASPPPAIASQIIPESGIQPGDLLITKRQWGAFYETGLDQQLRRRGIDSIVLGGIATNFGVESTARAGLDMGYQLVFVEDAMTSLSTEAHQFAIQHIFPRMGRVRQSADIVAAFAN